jgi:hypothetical protein
MRVMLAGVTNGSSAKVREHTNAISNIDIRQALDRAPTQQIRRGKIRCIFPGIIHCLTLRICQRPPIPSGHAGMC